MSRDYHQDRRERWPLVSTLLALGFTYQETARLIGWSAGTIQNDIQARGGMAKCFPNRPSKAERFPGLVQRLAEHMFEPIEFNELEQSVRQALMQHLMETLGLAEFAHGVWAGLKPFLHPRVYPEQEPYVALVAAVLRINEKPEPEPDLVGLVLRGIDLKDYQAPTDLNGFRDLIVQEAHELSAGRKMCPHWRADDHEWIDACLHERLAPKHLELVIKTFGLDGNAPMSMTAAGRLVYPGRSNEHIRQNFYRAIRQLRWRAQVMEQFEDMWWTLEPNEVRSLRYSLAQTREQIVKLERQVLHLEMVRAGLKVPNPNLDADPIMIQNLMKPVSGLELTVRTKNCLQNSNIEFIFELAYRTEADMLKTKNFGRKSLNELKEILCDLGLYFNLNLPRELIGDLLAWRVLMTTFKCHCWQKHDPKKASHPNPELIRRLNDCGVYTWAHVAGRTEAELRALVPDLTDEELIEIQDTLTKACTEQRVWNTYYYPSGVDCTPLKIGQIPEWLLPLL